MKHCATIIVLPFLANALNRGILDHVGLIIFVLFGLIGLLLYATVKNHIQKLRLEKVCQQAEQKLLLTNEELAAAQEQLKSSDQEFNNQFIELQDQKEKLKISRERYRLAAEGADVGIWDLDFVKNEVYLSNKAKEIMGFSQTHNHIMSYEDIYHRIIKADQADVFDKFHQCTNKETDNFTAKCRIKLENDKFAWISFIGRALFDHEGQVIRMAGSLNNINKEKIAEAKINRLAFYDALTDIPNRAYFNQLIDEYVHNKKHEKFALLFMDIDNFKAVNESVGHTSGDEILCKIVEVFKKLLSKGSTLFRFGGDQFVIVVPDIHTNTEIKAFVDMIMSEFQKPFKLKGIDFFITLSIGISTYPFDGETAEDLLKHADIALNNIKFHGKNGYKLFSFDLDETVTNRLKLERDLRQAVEKKQFELYYQPKLDVKRNEIIGYEALIRWHHPERGMVSPLEFIPMAEETGLIIPIGEWVIHTAAEQLRSWHLEGHAALTIAVNLSGKQFQDAHLVNRFKEIIGSTGVDITKLELEITETTALYDIDYAILVLNELKSLGLKISLDDFGTGYSSLNYLTQLPIDHLKIDKSFLQNAIMQKSGEQIIRSVIGLAHACNLKVTAEGVETKSQLEFLRNENCDMIQGFYISKPVTQLEAIGFMNRI